MQSFFPVTVFNLEQLLPSVGANPMFVCLGQSLLI